MIKEIRQMTGAEIAVSCALFLSVISPGVLSIWIFAPHLIDSLTAPKLLLLGSSFTTPVLAFNFAAILLLRDWVRKKEGLHLNPFFFAFIQGAGGTIALSFFLIIFHILTGANLIWLLKIFLLSQIGVLIILAIERKVSIQKTRALKPKYSMTIAWSDEDEAYVAEVPALEGCLSHGATYEEAAKNIQEAMELWLETATKHGDSIPEPDIEAK